MLLDKLEFIEHPTPFVIPREQSDRGNLLPLRCHALSAEEIATGLKVLAMTAQSKFGCMNRNSSNSRFAKNCRGRVPRPAGGETPPLQ